MANLTKEDVVENVLTAISKLPPRFPAKSSTGQVPSSYAEKLFELIMIVRKMSGYHRLGHLFISAIAELYAALVWNNQSSGGSTYDLMADLHAVVKDDLTQQHAFERALRVLKVRHIESHVHDVMLTIKMVVSYNFLQYQIPLQMLFMPSLKHMTNSYRCEEFRKLWHLEDYPLDGTEYILTVIGDVIPIPADCGIRMANMLYDAIVDIHQHIFW